MEFQIAGGSVPGTDHTKPGQPGWTNNHDAFQWRRTDNCLVAVVCDGCGSESHSEVGAKVAAQLLIRYLAEAAEKYVMQCLSGDSSKATIDFERVKTLTLSHIAVLASAMGGSFSQTMNDYFLFTVVGTVVTPWTTFLFSMGDGVFVVNGEVVPIGPFPNNTPPYMSYCLTGSSEFDRQPELSKFQVNRQIPTNDLQSLVLGSDGLNDLIKAANRNIPHRTQLVGGIEQFWMDDQFFKNGDAVRRRLALVNKEGAEVVSGSIARVTGGLLPDDTTLVVIRKKPTQSQGV